MRTYLTAVLLLLTLSCKKDNIKTHIEALQGSWKLAYYYGGFTGMRITPLPGELTILKFNSTTVEKYTHDTLLATESFTVTRKKDEYDNKMVPFIQSEHIVNGAFSIRNDTLSFYMINVMDGGSNHYVRYRP
jgi:hypothetical protein